MQAAKKGDKHEETIVKRGGGRQHDDEHGGAWKVAFADFCMALMALFLVLWLIAARESSALKNIVRDNTAAGLIEGSGGKHEIAGNPSGSLIERFTLPRSNGGSQGANAGGKTTSTAPARTKYESPSELAALAHALQQMSADAGLASNLATVVTPDGLRVMLHDTDRQGMFVRGSPIPTDRFSKLLRAMAPLFENMENQMLVVGHTDSLQYTSSDPNSYSNWSLSAHRALAARSRDTGRRCEPADRVTDPDLETGGRRRRHVRHADPDRKPGQGRIDHQAGRGRAQGTAQPTAEKTMTIQSKTRGPRMKITGASTPSVTIAPQAGGPAAAPAAPVVVPASASEALESSVLQPAQSALKALPDFDAEKVAELRDALSKGELPFDAGRLAGLIQRFHGSQG
jgi:chemotaxis protein MotB